jgi:hypothetical protein
VDEIEIESNVSTMLIHGDIAIYSAKHLTTYANSQQKVSFLQ